MPLKLYPATRALIALVFTVLGLTTHAQDLPPGVQFGMAADALRQALPGIESVIRPQRLAGGLAGTLRSPPESIAGVVGQRTFFFAGGQLRRVEFFADTRGQPDSGVAAFDRLLAWGRGRYGPEVNSGAYAAWSLSDTDIYVQLAGSPRPGVRLVVEARKVRDGGEL